MVPTLLSSHANFTENFSQLLYSLTPPRPFKIFATFIYVTVAWGAGKRGGGGRGRGGVGGGRGGVGGGTWEVCPEQ